jgi:hypothetical protein
MRTDVEDVWGEAVDQFVDEVLSAFEDNNPERFR